MGAWNRIGDLAYRADEWARAKDAYRTVLDKFPPLTMPTAAARFALAEILYRESVTRLGRTRVRAELARAHLMYGEWLRRQRRRGDAREQLRTARQMLEQMGMDAFAERARRELRATGETVRKHALASGDELTAQEAQIVRLARDGLSNPEIGSRLFISARTVQYHLSKVFTKLDITSRSQLSRIALP